MTEKRLIFGLFFLLTVSVVILTALNIHGTNPDGKNWWSLAFAEPENTASFTFTIVNHTSTRDFSFAVLDGNTLLAEGVLRVEPGSSLTHQPTLSLPDTLSRLSITVTHDGRTETIYREL